MSAAQVSVSRRVLEQRGLVIIQEGRPVVVTVVNIWELNTEFYKLEHRPDIEGWTVEQLKLWLADVHTVNVSSHNESDIGTRSERNLTEDDKDVHTVNVNSHSEHSLTDKDNMSSNVHTVKQRRVSSNPESNPSKESKELSPPQKLFVALAELCHIELRAASEKQKGQLGKASKALVNLVTDLDQFKAKFPVYWAAMDWRGQKGQSPDPPHIQETYGDFCHWLQSGAPTQPKNGVKPHGAHQRTNQQPTGQELKSKPTYNPATGELVPGPGRRLP